MGMGSIAIPTQNCSRLETLYLLLNSCSLHIALFLSPLSVTLDKFTNPNLTCNVTATAFISVPIPTMFPLFRKNLLLPYCRSSSSSQVRKFLTSFQVCEFSSSPQTYCKQFDEDNVRVSVWWDFDNCGVPSGFSVLKVAPSIKTVLRANGYKGPVDICAYGDVSQFSKFQQRALSLTAIHLRHVTPGGRKNAYGHLLEDLHTWTFKNDPPVHIFLVKGDKDISSSSIGSLHRFRMHNFNILVACGGRASDAICSATTILWSWASILKGEDLNGKYFNYPPDGPFGLWYGGSKVPLENPLSATEEST